MPSKDIPECPLLVILPPNAMLLERIMRYKLGWGAGVIRMKCHCVPFSPGTCLSEVRGEFSTLINDLAGCSCMPENINLIQFLLCTDRDPVKNRIKR